MLLVGSIPPIRHCALGIGMLVAYIMSKYYVRQEKLWDLSRIVKPPENAWLAIKQQLIEGIVKKQAADLIQESSEVRIDFSNEGLATVFARRSLRRQILVSTKAICECNDDELKFLVCNAILCDRTAYWQLANLAMTGAAFVILLYSSVYIHTDHIGAFLLDAGVMSGLIALIWTLYGTGARKINDKREWALKTAMDYTGKPYPAATAALSSSTFADIPEGIRLKLEEIRRMGFAPTGDGDLDWLQDR